MKYQNIDWILKTNYVINLYEFWKDEIRNHFKGEEIIDLASKEYGQNIYKYLDETPVKIDFKEEVFCRRRY